MPRHPKSKYLVIFSLASRLHVQFQISWAQGKQAYNLDDFIVASTRTPPKTHASYRRHPFAVMPHAALAVLIVVGYMNILWPDGRALYSTLSCSGTSCLAEVNQRSPKAYKFSISQLLRARGPQPDRCSLQKHSPHSSRHQSQAKSESHLSGGHLENSLGVRRNLPRT